MADLLSDYSVLSVCETRRRRDTEESEDRPTKRLKTEEEDNPITNDSITMSSDEETERKAISSGSDNEIPDFFAQSMTPMDVQSLDISSEEEELNETFPVISLTNNT